MLHWLQGAAAWIGPVVTILGVPATVVGFVVAIYRGRRWIIGLFDGQAQQQAETKQAAAAAAQSADLAVAASREAAAHADAAGTQAYLTNENTRLQTDRLRQHDETIVFLAAEIGHVLDEVSMAGRVDRLLTTNVGLRNLLRAHGIPIPGEFAPPTPRDEGDATITGRHRLPGHTEAISVLTEQGDPE